MVPGERSVWFNFKETRGSIPEKEHFLLNTLVSNEKFKSPNKSVVLYLQQLITSKQNTEISHEHEDYLD